MYNIVSVAIRGVVVFSTVIAMLAGADAMAEAKKISGKFGISYNSHFVSYGADVWGGGNDFFGDRSTTFMHGNITLAATENLSFNVGAWADINDNVDSAIGGSIQEIDVWGGVSYKFGIATVGAVYQRWNYASDVEEIVDLSLGVSDADFLGKFALNPNLVWHIRTSGNGSQETGSAVVLSIGPGLELPSLALIEKPTLTFPAGITFFTTDDFQGGTDGGYAYSYLGASLGIPLSFIPSDYGTWALNFDVIGYFTDDDAIPNNTKQNFATGSAGLTLSF